MKKEWSVDKKWNPFNNYKLLAQVYRWNLIKENEDLPPPATISIDPCNICNFKCKWCNAQELLRNNLYVYMKDWIEIWTRSILFKWNKTSVDDRESIPYLGFEGFLFALERYNNIKFDTPIPSFFFDHIRYYLLNYFASKGKIKIELEELKETLSLVSLPNNIAFEKMLTLYQFREIIPKEYCICWDDALLSLAQGEHGLVSHNKTDSIKRHLYFNIKKAYKPIIRFILEGNIG